MAKANRSYNDEAFVQELRLVSNETKNNVDWIVGLYYMDQDLQAAQDSYMPGYQEWAGVNFADWWGDMGGFGMVYTDNDFRYRRNQQFTDKALFGELTYHFADNLRSTVGFRTFKNEFTNDTEMSFPIWPSFDASPSFATQDDDTLFKFNLSYEVDVNTMVYTTVSEGYRRGGANAVPLDGNFGERPEWQSYSSDSVINYEIGLKGNIGDGSHTYTVSAFLIDWTDPQLNTSTTWGFFTAANRDSAQTKGIEFELQGYLSDDVHYTLGFAHVNAELTADFYVPSGLAADLSTQLQAKKGGALPTTPENTLSLSLNHTYSLDNGLYLVSQLNGYYQSESFNYLGESERYQATIGGFSLFNASAKLSANNWDVTLYIKNLTNEDGVTGKITENHMGTDPDERFLGNSAKDYISLPRTLGLTMSYRF
jgi:iron complex outermembrane receptor protein